MLLDVDGFRGIRDGDLIACEWIDMRAQSVRSKEHQESCGNQGLAVTVM
jgi:hypothetical protein